MTACYYLPASQNICVSMFSAVMLLFLVLGISSDACSVNCTSANCSKWLHANVTDAWWSCGAQCNTTKVWRCKETSHERLLLLVECSESMDTGRIQGTKEPSKAHDIVLIFLYGAACGAGALILIILLLSTVSWCLKKKKRLKGGIKETNKASTQGTEDVEGDNVRTTFNALDETQNETQQGSSRRALMPPPYLADIARDIDAEEFEDAEPFGRSHEDLKKPLKQRHPLYENSKDEEGIYMHLIQETRQGNETSDLTTKSSKCSRQKRKETCAIKPGSSAISEETNKPASTRTDARPSSVAYVNGHLAQLYSNVR